MPLQATSGAASYDAFGGGVAAVPNYIEDVFSTYLYTGTASLQTISNGIDLSTKGGMVWVKGRNTSAQSATSPNRVFDTIRGAGAGLVTNTTAAQGGTGNLLSFDASGFSFDTPRYEINGSGSTYASWTFRKQPKFFDVVTYTGTGSAVTVNHNLGSTPGCIIIKATNNAQNWQVWHRSAVDIYGNGYLILNSTAAVAGGPLINSTSSTNFVVSSGASDVGYTYVCYVFAHNAGGFGLTGTDNVISCGSFSGNTTVDLGYEPQWVLLKNATSADNWYVIDNMRGWPVQGNGNANTLQPNTSVAEQTGDTKGTPTATGFTTYGFGGSTGIYIAIRRGPMKVPTDATKVFSPVIATQSGNTTISTGFPVDFVIANNRGGANHLAVDRLRGGSQILQTASTAAEVGSAGGAFDYQTSILWKQYADGVSGAFWNFQRAPSFFDEVCYTGTGATTALVYHNLGVNPELVIQKRRDSTSNWYTATASGGSIDKTLLLNTTGATGQTQAVLYTSETYIGAFDSTAGNISGATYVAYLFATCAGVSKVGSYTGNGSTQTINCGFTGGARFVLIKRTDSTGDWYVYDTARGMTTLTDPYLLLNSTSAESATLGSVTTVSTGFAVNASILAAINTNGASYIYLSIA